MKEKIKASLKTKYANLGVSDKAFDGVADMLSKTVTEENGIDAAVASAEPFLKIMQGETDRYRTRVAELEKGQTPPAPAQQPDALAKLTEQIEALTARVQTMSSASSREDKTVQAKSIFAGFKVAKDRQAIADKAWETVQMKFSDTTTPQEMADMAKTEFDSLCSLTGVNGYEPQIPEGGQEKAFADKLLALKKQCEADGTIPTASKE